MVGNRWERHGRYKPHVVPNDQELAMTETHAAMSIIARTSPLQVHRIHLGTFLQYFPRPWVPAPCFGIYRSRNSLPERKSSPAFFSMKVQSNRVTKTVLSSL